MDTKRLLGFVAGLCLSASLAFAQSAPSDVINYGGSASSAGGGSCTGAFCSASAPLAPNIGGTGLDNSASTGIPLWTAGTQSILGTTGTGTVVRSISPTFTGTILGAAETLSGILTTNVTGGGVQCLQASNTGVVTGTGSACGSGGGAVSSVFTRTGAVVAASNDYTIAQIAGLGTGIATALGINIGSAGAPVLFNGAGGTPSSLTLTNATGCAVSSCVGGLGTNVATFLGTPSSANLRAALTDETGTGVAYFVGGALGTPSSVILTNGTGLVASTGTTATGTPSSTTYLRGDNTWSTPSGSGTVTSVATGACLTGGTITTTGTISGTYAINAQTGTTYTFVAGDACQLVTFSNASSVAVTLPQATGSFTTGWGTDVQNKGAGTVTITPTTSTINGAATLVLTQNQGCTIVSDGTNYQVSACTAVGGSASGVSSLAGTANQITASASTGAVTLSIPSAFTFPGTVLLGQNGGASAPAMKFTGTIFAGTSTTAQPLVLIQPSNATGCTAVWATAGTALGICAHSTAGNLLDLQTDGVSQFSIAPNGTVTAGFIAAGNIQVDPGSFIGYSSKAVLTSPVDGTLDLTANNGTTFGTIELANLVTKGATPTLTGTCTTGTKVGGQTAGTFVATCTAQTIIVTFLLTAPNGWKCDFKDRTTPADLINQASSTTTSCTTASSTTAASDVVAFNAVAYLRQPGSLGEPANDNRVSKAMRASY